MEGNNMMQRSERDEGNTTQKHSVHRLNVARKVNLSRLDQLALWTTRRIGTVGFFLLIFGWTVCWLGWNMLAPKSLTFDPYPGFVLWLFISNLIQIHLMPLIMIGQTLEGRHAEARAEADYEVNTKAEQEILNILQKLDAQHKTIERILLHIEAKN